MGSCREGNWGRDTVGSKEDNEVEAGRGTTRMEVIDVLVILLEIVVGVGSFVGSVIAKGLLPIPAQNPPTVLYAPASEFQQPATAPSKALGTHILVM